MKSRIMNSDNGVNGAKSHMRGGVALGRAGREASQVVIQRNPHKPEEPEDLGVRLATWNVGSLTGKSGEVVEVLWRRKVDICCIQEVRWKGSGAKMLGQKGRQYKVMWSGDSSKDAGVAVLVGNEWIDKVVNVNRVNERIVVIKLVIGAVLVNILSVYAPQVGRTIEEKDKFWEELFDIVNNIPSTEKVVVAGDLNGHIGKERDGYETIHGGYSFGMRNAEGERILEFADATNMVVCNSVFEKRESQLITYESGGVRSTVDYILSRNLD